VLTLDPVQTLACGGLCLIAGYVIRRRVPLLARFNIPAPVIGGLLVALAVLACRYWDFTPVRFDTGLKEPLMIAFFASIGFGASYRLLRRGRAAGRDLPAGLFDPGVLAERSWRGRRGACRRCLER
jgi:ESS family glutamate:Na+ symporter